MTIPSKNSSRPLRLCFIISYKSLICFSLENCTFIIYSSLPLEKILNWIKTIWNRCIQLSSLNRISLKVWCSFFYCKIPLWILWWWMIWMKKQEKPFHFWPKFKKMNLLRLKMNYNWLLIFQKITKAWLTSMGSRSAPNVWNFLKKVKWVYREIIIMLDL